MVPSLAGRVTAGRKQFGADDAGFTGFPADVSTGWLKAGPFAAAEECLAVRKKVAPDA